MEHVQQFVLVDGKKGRRRNGSRRAHADRLTRHAALAKKVARTKHREHSHLARRANHREFYVALLDVHDALGRVTLTVNLLVFLKFSNLSCHTRSIAKGLRIERLRFGFLNFHSESSSHKELESQRSGSLGVKRVHFFASGFPVFLSGRKQRICCFNCASTSSAIVTTSGSNLLNSTRCSFLCSVEKMLTCGIRDSSTTMAAVWEEIR